MSSICCNDHDWGDYSFDLENLFKPHDEYEIDYNVCNNIKSGFGKVMTLVNVNPTILEECQLCIHVDPVKNMFCDTYIVEFAYVPTCNYYQRGKYGFRNFHVTKLPLVMLRLLLFLSASLHMLVFACYVICLPLRCLCIGSMLDLDVFVTCFMMLLLCFNSCLSCEQH